MNSHNMDCRSERASRRVVSAPATSQAIAKPHTSPIETLFFHPNVRIVAFTAPVPSSLPSLDAARLESGTLAPSSSLERTIAVGSLLVYRAPGSVAFLNCGSALQPILPKSQCWCIEDNKSKYVLQIRRPTFWRIELPVSAAPAIGSEQANAFEQVLAGILQFERTYCPFQRNFSIELSEDTLTPTKKKPWKPKHSPAAIVYPDERKPRLATARVACTNPEPMVVSDWGPDSPPKGDLPNAKPDTSKHLDCSSSPGWEDPADPLSTLPSGRDWYGDKYGHLNSVKNRLQASLSYSAANVSDIVACAKSMPSHHQTVSSQLPVLLEAPALGSSHHNGTRTAHRRASWPSILEKQGLRGLQGLQGLQGLASAEPVEPLYARRKSISDGTNFASRGWVTQIPVVMLSQGSPGVRDLGRMMQHHHLASTISGPDQSAINDLALSDVAVSETPQLGKAISSGLCTPINASTHRFKAHNTLTLRTSRVRQISNGDAHSSQMLSAQAGQDSTLASAGATVTKPGTPPMFLGMICGFLLAPLAYIIVLILRIVATLCPGQYSNQPQHHKYTTADNVAHQDDNAGEQHNH